MFNAIAVPLGKLLFYIYSLVNSYGLSIVIFTILVKLILMPLTIKQTKSMKQMQELNPKIKALQKKYGHDKQKLNEKTMELYRQHNANPFTSGCLPLLLQLPILFALFQVLRLPETYVFTPETYDAVGKSFLWIKDLSATGSLLKDYKDPIKWILPILAAGTTYYQSKMVTPKNVEGTQNTMNTIMPLMIGYFSFSFPAGVTLYWVLSNTFQIVQQYFGLGRGGTVKEESN
ncbi:MAG: YidC/Oxa1 family membrane protein insertase [Bacillota bacterium]|nr:YidC/Oxa1 family membrane protein insertase [Bacillota bacterium]MDD3298029.1 YidC/Oxa1 family membrane protein insertase [Bacillota bacterium]MDD3850060.1 YidC/Oxa1 family membrane protein insertase [Bacillota bacterium]MDD4706703.1 YidC/Oxa1 family membrane protein insertase [Bacillota bacterium]